MSVSNILQHNTKLLYLNNFLAYSYYIDAVDILFGTHYLHLNYFQAGSLFFVGWLVSIATDFIGGVLADKFGRKPVQIWGLALQALAWAPYLFVRSYPVLLAANVVWGFGLALSSNTLQAVVYEQAKDLTDTKMYQRLNAVSQVWTFAGIALASLLGGSAYTLDPRLPYGLTVLTLVLAVLVSCRIQVPPRIESELNRQDEKQHIIATAFATIRASRQLRYFLAVSFMAGIVGDMLFSYYQPYFISLHVTALGLGAIYFAIRIVSGLGSYVMRKLLDHVSAPMIQMIFIALGLATAGLLYILKLPLVALAPLFFAIGSGFTEPNMRLFINSHAKDSARAATLSLGMSIMNFGVGIGFMITYWLADKFASVVELRILLALLLATLLISVLSFLRQKTVPVAL